MTQEEALIYLITAGPHKGRICVNDDDDHIYEMDLDDVERSWYKQSGIIWQYVSEGNLATDEEVGEAFVERTLVTFGFPLVDVDTFAIPYQFLTPASTNDLVQRHGAITEQIARAIRIEAEALEDAQMVSLLKEQSSIANEIWNLEKVAFRAEKSKSVFLCHSSIDKGFVRQVYLDLSTAGHKPWLDEFEIGVGESIVEKINNASGTADALILFLSNSSVSSNWVRREWSSALARQLSAQSIIILPALIEDCQIPPLLADVKFADFRENYAAGLKQIGDALNKSTNSLELEKEQ